MSVSRFGTCLDRPRSAEKERGEGVFETVISSSSGVVVGVTKIEVGTEGVRAEPSEGAVGEEGTVREAEGGGVTRVPVGKGTI